MVDRTRDLWGPCPGCGKPVRHSWRELGEVREAHHLGRPDCREAMEAERCN